MGNSEDDILIGGTTAYDCDHEALCAIFEEWLRDLDYAQRINHLTNGGGLNGIFTLNIQTVFDDGVFDMLTGASGLDWFFRGVNDKVTDGHSSEITTENSLSVPVASALPLGRRRGLFDAHAL